MQAAPYHCISACHCACGLKQAWLEYISILKTDIASIVPEGSCHSVYLCLRLEALCFRVVPPSFHPSEAWNTLFPPVHGSVGPSDQLWPFYGMSVRPSLRPSMCPSVRPERFPGIFRRTHGGNGLKCCMLMYRGHLQNWSDYGNGLMIFLILSLFWLCETGQIWGFRAFPRERMEGMAWHFACWCIMTTFRTN